MRLKIFLSSLLIILCYNLSAQTTITGIVTDSLNKPIPFASVYLSKTTFGTITNNEGFYLLIIPRDGVYELTTSCIGYKPKSYSIITDGFNQKINIKLSLSMIQLEEVTISAKAKIRVKNLTKFDKLFLGETVNAQNCRILNPNDIHLFRDPETNILKGYSVKPVRIENKALGYTIIYDLTDFVYDSKSDFLRFSGNYYFQPSTGNSRNNKKWTQNRLNAYYGSRLHFLRALYSDSFKHENFKISEYELNPVTKEYREIAPIEDNKILISQNGSFTSLYYNKPVLIRYTNNHAELETGILGFNPSEDKSTIEFNDTLTVYKNGYFDNPYSVTWGGKMGNERIADMLPFDYLPNSTIKENPVDEKVTSPIEKYLLSEQKTQSADQLFVHLDRNMYSPGDTIYFQAYIRDRFTNEFESKSVSLYALLFDDKKAKIDSSRFRIENSTASGWMSIPSGAASGKYHFAAFTSMMQNFDPSEAFQTDISIKGKDKTAAKGDISYDPEYFEMKFLPEGGNLVAGIEQRIGFNATDYKGYPVHIEGLLKSSSGLILDTIKSGICGPGSFICTPETGMYVEIIKGSDKEKRWPLPDPKTSGICMSIKPISDRSFSIEIQSSSYNNDTVTVSGIMNSIQVFSKDLIMSMKQRMVVETDQLLPGVAQITLFNKDLRPLAERLYYVNADKRLMFNISTSDTIYRQGQETEMTISVTDGLGNPTEGIFSISVADSISGHDGEIFTPGIEYALNYHPYFQRNLPPKVLGMGLEKLTNEDRDLMLMVYGWSRYNWDLNEKRITRKDPINYDLINIKIPLDLKSPPSDKKLNLISLEEAKAIHLISKNNEDISLSLDSLPKATTTVTLIPDGKARKKITSAILSIPFNSLYFRAPGLFTPQPTIPKETYSIPPVDYKILLGDTTIEIPEVRIMGYQRIKTNYQNIYEERYQYAEIKRSDPELLHRSLYLETVIRTLANPRLITYDAVYIRQKTSVSGGAVRALVVLDGMPLYSNGWEIAKTIPVTEIASVTVLKGNQGRTIYGLEASGGVIFVNTMFHDPTLNRGSAEWNKNKNDKLLQPIKIYRSDIEFYNPTKFDVENDPAIQRGSTYYWNPEVYFNGKEAVKIKYINLKHKGPVIITVNGESVNNLVGSGRASYRVK